MFLKLGVNDQNLRLPGDRSVNFTTGVDDFSYDRKGSDDPFDFAIENGTFFTAGFIQSINNNTELLVDMGYKTKETDLFLKANQEFRTTNHSNLYFSPKLKLGSANEIIELNPICKLVFISLNDNVIRK